MFVVTKELARRLEVAEATVLCAHMEGLAALPGNPFGAEVRRFGNVVAAVTAKAPEFQLTNRILCAGSGDEADLAEAAAFLESRGVPVRVDVCPLHSSRSFLKHLSTLGLTVGRFHVTTFGEAISARPKVPAGLSVLVAETPEQTEVAIRILTACFNSPTDQGPLLEAFYRALVGRPDCRFYIACVDDIPGAAAILHMRDRVGSLTGAGTLPAYRGRGAQTALIRRRMADAAELGCDLMTGQTGNGTVSQNNMERSGMRIAFSKADFFKGGSAS